MEIDKTTDKTLEEDIEKEPMEKETEEKTGGDGSFFKGLVTGFVSASVIVILTCIIFFLVQGNNKNDGNVAQQASAPTVKPEFTEEFQRKYHAIGYLIDKNYLNADKVTEEEIYDGMFHGYLSSIGDKYAEYYSPTEYKELLEHSSGEYGGIGVYLSEEKDTGRFVIVSTFEGEPGDKAGLKAGDVVTYVNDESVAEMTLDELSEAVKGEPGTTVKLTVYRDGKKLDFTIERKKIEMTTVAYQMIENGTIGYIYISSFDELTQGQFKDAVDALERQHAKGLIIDVRNNGGGVLTSAIEILDRLLPKGLVLYTENKNGRASEYHSNAEEVYEKPYCILINEYSASASEVFAGAIQDFGTAKIIGTKSYGKGVIQSIFPLKSIGDGSGIKMTTEKYFTPKGRNIDGVGIEPDIKVEIDEKKEVKKGDYIYDTQMQEAIKHIQSQIK